MEQPRKFSPIATRAFRLFVDELDRQVRFAKRTLNDPVNGSRDDFEEMRRMFHMIKGGAGFFGLSNVAGLASEIESKLKQPIERVIEQCDELNSLVAKVEKLAGNLNAKQKS